MGGEGINPVEQNVSRGTKCFTNVAWNKMFHGVYAKGMQQWVYAKGMRAECMQKVNARVYVNSMQGKIGKKWTCAKGIHTPHPCLAIGFGGGAGTQNDPHNPQPTTI